MQYILISIICSVLVGVLLKIVKKTDLSFYQIITWNYTFALLLTYVVYKPKFRTDFGDSTATILLTLSFLLPCIFIFQAKAIKHSGIVKTDIAQRLSLFISLVASYFIFKEEFNLYKIIGLSFAFIAIFFAFYRQHKTESKNTNKWYFLVLVLLGFGAIDILFKKISALREMTFTEVLYIIFTGALLVSIAISTYYILIKRNSLM